MKRERGKRKGPSTSFHTFICGAPVHGKRKHRAVLFRKEARGEKRGDEQAAGSSYYQHSRRDEGREKRGKHE